jgi:hypothetical protein
MPCAEPESHAMTNASPSPKLLSQTAQVLQKVDVFSGKLFQGALGDTARHEETHI